jgi:hypothetical protein
MTTAILDKIRQVKAATAAVQLKMRLQQRDYHRAAFEQLHLKKVEKVEADLQESLEPLFADQIKSVETKLRKLAASKKKAFCPTGPGGGVDPTCGSGGGGAAKVGAGEIPKPPKVPAVLQPKYDEIYAAAKKGDRAAVEAVKTNPNAQSPYPKKLHQYKTEVLAAMDTSKGDGKKPSAPKKADFTIEELVDAPGRDVQQAMAKLGLNHATVEQIARAAGAISGAHVQIAAGVLNEWIRVDVQHEDYKAVRVFDKEGLNNANFSVTKPGSGLGTRIFSQQVAEASSLGIKKIHTYAAGEPDIAKFNGYYTWPRLGYDGRIPRSNMQNAGRKLLKQQFPDAKKISDLMRTKAGRDFWKNHGAGASLQFDLSPNSQSRQVLDAYVAAKFGSGAAGGKSAGDDFRRRRAAGSDLGQPPDGEYVWGGEPGTLAKKVFDPSEWDEELIDRALPPLAKAMAVEMLRALKELGVDPRRRKPRKDVKASTATEWMEDWNIDLEDVVFDTPSGGISMGFVTEYPTWMKTEIKNRLQETFEQDYWAKVNETTFGDIEGYLKKGLKDGWSIQKMADEIMPQLMNQGNYAEWRAKTIARTESGNALNGARVAAADKLIDEIPELPMKKVWLSVLGTTTRREHADLDGVPANKDGLWKLGGVWVRWPGDINLPVAQRANCQCTIVVSWGVTDESAEELIAEYGQRLAEDAPDEEKAFCPTGPGGGVDPTCGSGGGSAGPKAGHDSRGVPMPPKVPGSIQHKFDSIYNASLSGKKSDVEAVKTNPDAQSPYPKKLHQYKLDVLKSMDTAVPTATPAAKPVEQPKPAAVEAPVPKPIPMPKPAVMPSTATSDGFTIAEKKQRFDEHLAKAQELLPEIHKLDKISRDKSLTSAKRIQARLDHKRVNAARQALLYKAQTERMSAEAADPKGYRQLREEFEAKHDAYTKADQQFAEKLVAAGVTAKEDYHSFSALDIGSKGYSFDNDDPYPRQAKNYPGLTREQYTEAQELSARYSELRAQEDFSKPYYGEPATPRQLNQTGLNAPSPILPGKVGQGGADDATRDFMGQAEILIQVKPNAFVKIVSTERIKNKFEGGATGSVGAGNSDYNNSRKTAEARTFDIDPEAPAASRPVYGYLQHPDRAVSSAASMGMTYGTVQVVLKPSAKERTSYTVGDSLDDYSKTFQQAGSVSNPINNNFKPEVKYEYLAEKPERIVKAGPTKQDWFVTTEVGGQTMSSDSGYVLKLSPQYIEAQIHGGIQLSDIAAFRVPRGLEIPDKTRTKLQKAGVSLIEVPPRHPSSFYGMEDWDSALVDSINPKKD